MQSLKEKINQTIKEQGVIAIIRGVEEKDLYPLLDALYLGGMQVAEITFGKEDNETSRLIEKAVAYVGDKMFIGAGTVTDLPRARLAYNSGAQFLVSPNTDKCVIDFAKENSISMVCGAFTPSEIYSAYSFGADFVKVFPANFYGAEYIKTVKAPFPQIPLIAFAGVTGENIAQFIKAGAIGAGIGSELINLKQIKAGNFNYVTEKAKQLLTAVKQAKGE